jgi:hypothetical protein
MTRARGALQKNVLVWKVGALGHRMTAEIRKKLVLCNKEQETWKE